MLLARWLVESGVDLVTAQLSGDLCGGVGNWDDHAVKANCFEAIRHRLQFMDKAVASLIEDLYERGLDKRVMVVVTGEFCRTPKISYQKKHRKGNRQRCCRNGADRSRSLAPRHVDPVCQRRNRVGSGGGPDRRARRKRYGTDCRSRRLLGNVVPALGRCVRNHHVSGPLRPPATSDAHCRLSDLRTVCAWEHRLKHA